VGCLRRNFRFSGSVFAKRYRRMMKQFEQERTERTENPDGIGIASVSSCSKQLLLIFKGLQQF
jgi:hypothetical protein